MQTWLCGTADAAAAHLAERSASSADRFSFLLFPMGYPFCHCSTCSILAEADSHCPDTSAKEQQKKPLIFASHLVTEWQSS